MAIAFDTQTFAEKIGTTSVTASHTCTGSNLYLIVYFFFYYDGITPSGATYNSVAMTDLGKVRSTNGFVGLQAYGLKNPATGAHNAVVSYTGNDQVGIHCVSYTGVDQTTPIGTVASAGGKSTSLAVTVTSATGELVSDAGVLDDDCTGGFTLTATGSQTQEAQNHTVDSCGFVEAVGDKAGAASTSMTWTGSSSQDWCVIGIPMKPASAGGTTVKTLAATGVGG